MTPRSRTVLPAITIAALALLATGCSAVGAGPAAGTAAAGGTRCATSRLTASVADGGGDGTQIGNPATLDRSTPHQTLTLRPGGEVQAIVTVADAGNWDSATCHPRVTDGFRVIPPGSRQSLFVPATGPLFESCAATAVHQLTTSALAAF